MLNPRHQTTDLLRGLNFQLQAAAEAERKRVADAEEKRRAAEQAAAEQTAAEQAAAEQAAAVQAAAVQAAAEEAAAEKAAAEQAAAKKLASADKVASLVAPSGETKNVALPPISKLRAAAGLVKANGSAARNWRHTAEHLPSNPLEWTPEQVMLAAAVPESRRRWAVTYY